MRKRSKIRQSWNFSVNNFNLLFSGSGWERKGLDWSLELTKKTFTSQCADKILGRRKRCDKNKYQEVAKRLGIIEAVEFIGPVKNIQGTLSNF